MQTCYKVGNTVSQDKAIIVIKTLSQNKQTTLTIF